MLEDTWKTRLLLIGRFSSNKIVVCILKRYGCCPLCFLLHSLLRRFHLVNKSRSGHPLQLYLHTLCYWLEDGGWLRPLATIYNVSHFSPSVVFSLSLHTEFSSCLFLSTKIYSFTSQTTQVNCRERAPICELLSQR